MKSFSEIHKEVNESTKLPREEQMAWIEKKIDQKNDSFKARKKEGASPNSDSLLMSLRDDISLLKIELTKVTRGQASKLTFK